jgi:uncharacterized membrane protein YdbT with pleckstrin-like domain
MIDVSWIDTALRWVFVAGIVVLIGMVIFRFVNWKTTRFAITSERVAYQSGMFKRRGVSIPLNRVNNVNFDQSFLARILNNGVVVIESAGETGDSVFENIPDPDRVRTLIFSEMDEYGATRSEREAAAVARALKDDASTAAGSASVEERLAQLDRLRASGAISEEEYAQKRSDILGSL